MRIGYPCINFSLPCRSSRTFRLASYSEEMMQKKVRGNLGCLLDILQFNASHQVGFFRITSDLIPFASHPVCTFPWRDVFRKQLHALGKSIRDKNIRVSMHPDQFVLINSKDEGILKRSVYELEYHADVLDMLGTDTGAKIQIHVGGVYGEKARSMERFIERYESLPEKVRKRLVIENDERLYDIADCLEIHRKTGIPVIFDALHFSCNNRGEDMLAALEQVFRTWGKKDGLPIVDYSSQEKGKRKGSHAATIDMRAFRKFIDTTSNLDFDIMLEIKDKEKSALKACALVKISKSKKSP